MQDDASRLTVRPFRAGDGPVIAEAWTAAAPRDGITYRRFRDLVLLDRNFDRDGLLVAEDDGRIIGAAYAVRRQVAFHGADLEPGCGWLPFFFVHPASRGRGVGRALLTAALNWLRDQGVQTAYFSSYTPNYFLPGLDAAAYPAASRLLESLGFTTQYESVAMDRSLVEYETPVGVREKVASLVEEGYSFGTPTDDELVELIDIAGSRFNPDWARAIREAVTAGMPLERILVARAPGGNLLGWAMHGTYESVVERFGPFGVLPESRGLKLGEVLLHLTLERMRAVGAHSAWFLWTDEGSPAGRLYLKTGFAITRTFSILHASLS